MRICSITVLPLARYARAGSTRNRPVDIGRVGDDRGIAAGLKKIDHRLNLGRHAAFGKMNTRGQVCLGLLQGQMVKPGFPGRAIMQRYFFDGRADNKKFGAKNSG